VNQTKLWFMHNWTNFDKNRFYNFGKLTRNGIICVKLLKVCKGKADKCYLILLNWHAIKTVNFILNKLTMKYKITRKIDKSHISTFRLERWWYEFCVDHAVRMRMTNPIILQRIFFSITIRKYYKLFRYINYRSVVCYHGYRALFSTTMVTMGTKATLFSTPHGIWILSM